MRITIAAVGRRRKGPEQALFDHFARRISWPLEIREVEEKKKLPPDQLKRREGELLAKACPVGATRVALDETGRALTSSEFATRMGAWRDQAIGDVAFLIGGAAGLDRDLTERAELVLSLGALTWPNMLVRGMLAEQIYRAQQILAGHPYHRE